MATKVVRFTDREWKAIVMVLPQSKRLQLRTASMKRDVEAKLNYFLRYRESLWTALPTKRSIKKIQNYATKLRHELEGLMDDPVFLSAGLPHGRISDGEIPKFLRDLKHIQTEMDGAEGRLSMKPGRKSVRPTDFLITFLNWIQRGLTRKEVVRSNKHTEKASAVVFIKLCCRKVGLTEGQVERSLKRTIAITHMIHSTGQRASKRTKL